MTEIFENSFVALQLGKTRIFKRSNVFVAIFCGDNHLKMTKIFGNLNHPLILFSSVYILETYTNKYEKFEEPISKNILAEKFIKKRPFLVFYSRRHP